MSSPCHAMRPGRRKSPRHLSQLRALSSLGVLLAVGRAFVLGSSSSSSSSSMECMGTPAYISDGECDSMNNNKFCGYDGGDCCSCTCVDTADHACSDSGFHCLDPAASCVGEFVEDSGDLDSSGTSSGLISDSDRDTSSGGVDEDAATTSGSSGSISSGMVVTASSQSGEEGDEESSCYTPWLGDGHCDEGNNIDECSFDAGDCCSCTCIESVYECASDFNCIDPAAACDDATEDGAENDLHDDDHHDENDRGDGESNGFDSSCYTSDIGNGFCDSDNNREECGYDGGDCCPCTCADTPTHSCGAEGATFDCVDPTASCSTVSSTSGSSPSSSSSWSSERSMITKVSVGIVMAFAVVSSFAFLFIKYRHLAAQKSTAASAASARRAQSGIAEAAGGTALPTFALS